MSLEPIGISRVRVMGKKATNAQVAKYIKSALANPNLTKSKLATTLGTSRPTIDKYLALAETLRIETAPSKTTKTTKLEETQPEFLRNPHIQTWREFMRRKTHFTGETQYLTTFYQICRTLKCPPQYFILGDTPAEVLEHGRKLTAAFMQEYNDGTAQVIYHKKINGKPTSNPQQAAYRFSKAARDFMKSHGYQYPDGEGGVMSQSIAKFHGKYADLRIKEDTHQQIKAELADQYGPHSDEWLVYVLGVESMGRQEAILSATTQYEEVEYDGKKILITKMYESKTKHYKNGIWIKHLFDTELHAEIKKRAAKSTKMFTVTRRRMREISTALKAKYREHGLLTQGQETQGDPETSYYLKKPYHVLRHLGAQRLLRATGWNVAYVAQRGWKTTQELVDSYGEMPPEMEIAAMKGAVF